MTSEGRATPCHCPDGIWLYAACSALGKAKGDALRRDLSLVHWVRCEGRDLAISGDWSPAWLRRCYRRGLRTLRTLGWTTFEAKEPA